MLPIKGPDTCTTDQTTRPTTSRVILAQLGRLHELSSSSVSKQKNCLLCTITQAHLPDCSCNFIEVVLQLLRLCTASSVRRVVFCLLSSLIHLSRISSAALSVLSSSNFSTPNNSFAITMISGSLFELPLQLLTQVFSCLLSSTPTDPLIGRLLSISSLVLAHPICRGNPGLQRHHRSVSLATWSSCATHPMVPFLLVMALFRSAQFLLTLDLGLRIERRRGRRGTDPHRSPERFSPF